MVYNPATDFLALWRNIAGQVSKVEIPGLDYVVAALARAGVFTLSVSATAPVANQATTAWLQTAVPSNSAEGALFLWNPVTTAYAPATAALFLDMLQVSANQSGVSWLTAFGGPPVNAAGNNGDYAIRTDEPGGVYGPKTAGAWPATPLPGTTDIITSATFDNTFGAVEGQLIYRGPTLWQTLGIGAANAALVSIGGVPVWENLSALLDLVFGGAQGSILYRDAGLWETLLPGAATQVLTTNGPAVNPTWQPRTSEFSSGDTLLFYQTFAPVGWTKQTTLNDCGLRVTNGAVGVTAGSAFSTVFAQTTVGNTTLTQATTPSHVHTIPAVVGTIGSGGGATFQPLLSNAPGINTGSIGSDGAHSHSVNLSLAYVDVIIAAKD